VRGWVRDHVKSLVNKWLCETLGEGLSDRLCERFGEMFCDRKDEMLDPNMILVSFWQYSSMIQESLNLSQLPSPDEGLVPLVIADSERDMPGI
jgi:hypothetical protein